MVRTASAVAAVPEPPAVVAGAFPAAAEVTAAAVVEVWPPVEEAPQAAVVEVVVDTTDNRGA